MNLSPGGALGLRVLNPRGHPHRVKAIDFELQFDIAGEREVRLWNKYSSNTFEQLSKLEHTVQDAGLFSGQLIIIEVRNEDGSWPRQSRRYLLTVFSDILIKAIVGLRTKSEVFCYIDISVDFLGK